MRFVPLMVLMVMAMPAVFAVDMVINPQIVTMAYTDTKSVDVCIYRGDGSPYTGLDLEITNICQDLDGDEACGPLDGDATGMFSATVIASPTGADGCGQIGLETTNAMGGIFAYQVNGKNAEVIVNTEGGLVYIPEFSVLASAVVLGAAGLFIYRRRR